MDNAAVVAWFQRYAQVRSRIGQVWMRTDSFKETLLIIGAPQLSSHWRWSIRDVIQAVQRRGWYHEVLNLDSGKRFVLNEEWFSGSESGQIKIYERIS